MTAEDKTPSAPKSVVLLGGSGFMGTRLCARLHNAHDCRILDIHTSTDFPEIWHKADVRSVSDLRQWIPQSATLVNLAAEHRDDVTPRSLYDEVNVDGARNICVVAREKNIRRIIFTSSVAVYGFAPIGTDETGKIAPFNDYGRTKYEAEEVFRAWQAEAPHERSLVIVRPTVVFGERNRGNVYNLFKQIASGFFIMVGPGTNRKSVAYVENLAAFIQQSLSAPAGVQIYNYVDKPDFDMNSFVGMVRSSLNKSDRVSFRLPLPIALVLGRVFDGIAGLTGKKFAISTIRIRKFTANSVYETAITPEKFTPPVALEEAIQRTISFEFLDDNSHLPLFYSE